MRKIVDSNFLQSPKLREYLAKSRSNYAILTDYAAMEAYKGDTLMSIYKSMEILADYPEQVIVLKNTTRICGLKGKGSGLQSRLIDTKQTKEFGLYCKQLLAAREGNTVFEQQLMDHGREAEAHLNLMLEDAVRIKKSIEVIAKNFSNNELKILRIKSDFTDQMFGQLVESVMWVAGFLFRDHPKVKDWPSLDRLANTFIFRSALCVYLLALDWISVGGLKDAKPETIRNDMVDTNFVAFATYFDGLLSGDKKAKRIYRIAKMLINEFFVPSWR